MNREEIEALIDERVERRLAEIGVGAEYLTAEQAGRLIGKTARAMEHLRAKGGGPPFVRPMPTMVRYRRADVIAWAEEAGR